MMMLSAAKTNATRTCLLILNPPSLQLVTRKGPPFGRIGRNMDICINSTSPHQGSARVPEASLLHVPVLGSGKPAASVNALSTALSLAREALAPLEAFSANISTSGTFTVKPGGPGQLFRHGGLAMDRGDH